MVREFPIPIAGILKIPKKKLKNILPQILHFRENLRIYRPLPLRYKKRDFFDHKGTIIKLINYKFENISNRGVALGSKKAMAFN